MEAYITLNPDKDYSVATLKNCDKLNDRLDMYEELVDWFKHDTSRKIVFRSFEYDPYKDDIMRFRIEDPISHLEKADAFMFRLRQAGCNVYFRNSRGKDEWKPLGRSSIDEAEALRREYELKRVPKQMMSILEDISEQKSYLEMVRGYGDGRTVEIFETSISRLEEELRECMATEETRCEQIRNIWSGNE